MTASPAYPCYGRAEVLAVLREHFPGLAPEFKLNPPAVRLLCHR